jgi:hypothetical protein
MQTNKRLDACDCCILDAYVAKGNLYVCSTSQMIFDFDSKQEIIVVDSLLWYLPKNIF